MSRARSGPGARRRAAPGAALRRSGAGSGGRRGARRAGTARRSAAAPRRAAGLERLWSPWRMEYIRRAHAAEECLFCRVARGGSDRRHLVLARRTHALLMLNRFPYTPAHLMVAVARHAAEFRDLREAEREDLLDLTALAERALAAEYRPHGVNYGLNVGRVAGAGYPGHLHLHLVPRWDGDTNFMSTVGATRVLPESLARTWTRLRRALEVLERASGGTRGRSAGRRGR